MNLIAKNSQKKQLNEIVEEAYSRIFNSKPDHIEGIEVLPEEKYKSRVKELDEDTPNREEWGTHYINKTTGKSLILVKESKKIERTICYIGHEIGHSLSPYFDEIPSLKVLEEAKAYSFQNLWAEQIRRYNIGGLGEQISHTNQNLVNSPIEAGMKKAGAKYFSSLMINLVDRNDPGKLYTLMRSLDNNTRKFFSKICEKLGYNPK